MESTYLLTYLGLRCDWSPTLSVSKIRFASHQTRIKFYEEFISFILRNKQERIKTIPCSLSSRGFRNREHFRKWLFMFQKRGAFMRRFLPFYRTPTQDIRPPQNVSIQLCLIMQRRLFSMFQYLKILNWWPFWSGDTNFEFKRMEVELFEKVVCSCRNKPRQKKKVPTSSALRPSKQLTSTLR